MWINKKPIVEQDIEGATVIHIGSHQLEGDASHDGPGFVLQAHPFAFHRRRNVSSGCVKRKGLVLRSLLLPHNAPYNFDFAGENKVFAAPTSDTWVEHTVGTYTIKQRLARTMAIKDSPRAAISRSWEPGVHGPLISAIVVFFLIFLGLLLAPNKPEDNMKLAVPEQNQFTRMIFDGQKARARKLQAKNFQKILRGQADARQAKQAPGGDQGTKTPGGQKTSGARVINNLKPRGLAP